jgi:hypothetical protein
MVGDLVLPPMRRGITEASAIGKPSTRRDRITRIDLRTAKWCESGGVNNLARQTDAFQHDLEVFRFSKVGCKIRGGSSARPEKLSWGRGAVRQLRL